MTALDFTETTCGVKPEVPEHFHIAVIYDATRSARAALNVCNHIIAELSPDFLFHIALCDFGSFDGRHNDTPAMKSAGRASLVLIAAKVPLPERTCEWLDGWALDPDRRPRAVALMDGEQEPQAADSTRSCLAHLCAKHGIDLISTDELAPLRTGLAGFAGAHES